MRALFTDGANSVAHVALGFVAGESLALPFLFYQFVLQGDENAAIDSSEFVIGWLAAALLGSKAGALADKQGSMRVN